MVSMPKYTLAHGRVVNGRAIYILVALKWWLAEADSAWSAAAVETSAPAGGLSEGDLNRMVSNAPSQGLSPGDLEQMHTLHKAAPAHLNCTAKRYIDVVMTGVLRQLQLAGVKSLPKTSLAYHFDAGRSQPEGGSRAIPNGTVINASHAAGKNCTAKQLMACAKAAGGLVSLEGLGEYLMLALEHGIATPTPNTTAKFGWGPVASAMLADTAHHASKSKTLISKGTPGHAGHAGPAQVGGGSGAGFQLVCGDKGLSSSGGGGGGGAFLAKPSAVKGRLAANSSIGGGGGGGTQLFFPAAATDDPWTADRWLSWTTGGGSGCGTCKPGDKKCESSPLGVTCGAKLDDTGAVDVKEGSEAAKRWRAAVLRRCYEAGKLAVIGGGGGGSGAAECCKAVPSLNYAFGFRAEFVPPNQSELHQESSAAGTCCPNLHRWNVTNAGESSSGNGNVEITEGRKSSDDNHHSSVALNAGRRLTSMDAKHHSVAHHDVAPNTGLEPTSLDDKRYDKGNSNGGYLDPNDAQHWRGSPLSGPFENETDVDPFSMENSGIPSKGGKNRRPTEEEMIRQHAKRMGVSPQSILNLMNVTHCKLPSWLNSSSPVLSGISQHSPVNSKTKEPKEALAFIFKFNPLQGYLQQSADNECEGWGDWCCVCHGAQRSIACLEESDRKSVEWFLTEDCCESKLAKNTSSPGFVDDATPPRDNLTVAWTPGRGFVALAENSSDSYNWDGSFGVQQHCRLLSEVESSQQGKGKDSSTLGVSAQQQQGGSEEMPKSMTGGGQEMAKRNHPLHSSSLGILSSDGNRNKWLWLAVVALVGIVWYFTTRYPWWIASRTTNFSNLSRTSNYHPPLMENSVELVETTDSKYVSLNS